MISPYKINVGQSPITRIALLSRDQIVQSAADSLRTHSAWKRYEIECDTWHIPMPGCPEKVIVHFGMSRPAEQSRCNICVFADQFESFYLLQRGRPAHPMAPGVILCLLFMVREAIGSAITSCSTLIEHETDQLLQSTSPASILTYESVAPLLASHYTAMNDGVARLLWADLKAP